LIEKYNDLAREALSNGDKILSENYLQHADHFTRVLNEKEIIRREKSFENKINSSTEVENTSDKISENEVKDNTEGKIDATKDEKSQVEIN
tara:strand:+ start:158 stop:430 length:273 start_codon:yes stop_codon:yes gene_type:complete